MGVSKGDDPLRLPDEVQRALEENAKAVGQLTIRWERLRKSPWDKERLARDLGESEYAFFEKPFHAKVVLQDEKFYSYTRFPFTNAEGTVLFGHSEGSCDLQYCCLGSGMEYTVGLGGNPVLTIDRLTDLQTEGNRRMFRGDYFTTAGFWVAENVDDMGQAPASLVLKSLADGAEILKIAEVDRDGIACRLVELAGPESKHRYWLSIDKNLTVIYAEKENETGQVVYSVENSNFEQLPGTSLWLPKQSEQHWRLWGSNTQYFESPIVTEEFTVVELGNERADDSVFQFAYSHPGSFVYDARASDLYGDGQGKVEYRVPADPDDLDKVIKQSAAYLEVPEKKGDRFTTLLIVNGVALVLFVFLLVSWRFLRS